MADLVGGGPMTSSGNGRAPAVQIPGPTGSPGGIRGPREIMREREAREQRKRADEAARKESQRINAEEEARLVEERRMEERRAAEKRAAAAAGAAQRGSGESGQRNSGGTTGQRISDGSQNAERVGGSGADQPLQGLGRGGRAVGGGESAQPRPRPPPSQQARQGESSRTRPIPAQAGPSSAGPPQDDPDAARRSAAAAAAVGRSSFPHAFERWETLSAHWEGLTSFWIRRLEENSNEVNREPISQQLSRQVTDLSAAGANLFHAVVELQRLRASSERKFQRWFFETRAEQERYGEMQARLTQTLEDERRERAKAISEAVEGERQRTNVNKQLAEMRRELQISKEEARRAWEELGRREQEERERMLSLREGQPTMIGGVQVVPMMQGVPSRQASARAPQLSAQQPEEHVDYQGATDDSDVAYQRYARSQRAAPTDPFVEQQESRVPRTNGPTTSSAYTQGYSQAPAVQPASSSAPYKQQQHESAAVTPTEYNERTDRAEQNRSHGPSVHSGPLSDAEYEIDQHGHFVRDPSGNKVRYQDPVSDDDTDEYDVHSARERELAYLQDYGRAPVSSVEYGGGNATTATATAGRPAPSTTQPPSSHPEDAPDYSGEGYGSGLGWEAIPRHHHPTRLSDVLEEDERSRTSASQISRRPDLD